MSPEPNTQFNLAGLWRRVIAVALDFVVIGLALSLLAIPCFSLTAGRTQMRGPLIDSSRCAPLLSEPPGVTVPADFHANIRVECLISFLGAPVARFATIGRQSSGDGITTTRSVTFQLNSDGRLTPHFDLGWFYVPLFIIYCIVLESLSGRTLGSRAVGLLVIGPALARATTRQLLTRYAAIFAPVVPLVVFVVFGMAKVTAAPFEFVDLAKFGSMFSWMFVLLIPAFALAVWATVAVVRRRDPFYDRLAGTRVIRAR